MTELSKLKAFVTNNKIPFREVKSLFKDLNEHIQFIEGLLEQSQTCKNVRLEKAIKNDVRKLRSLITTISPTANDEIILPPKIKLTAEKILLSLKQDLGALILEVNA